MKRPLAFLIALSTIVLVSPGTTEEVRADGTCGPMDVVFVIDDTGSMGGALVTVQAQTSGLIDDIDQASGGDYQLGLVTFKDTVRVREPFSHQNGAATADKLATLTAAGGAALPEASDEAMRTVIDGLSARPGQTGGFPDAWRQDATRILIIVTDAPPAGFDDAYTVGVDDVRAQQMADNAAAKHIKISSVFVPTGGDYSGQKALMQQWASTTGGLFTQTDPTGAGTGDALRSFIGDCGGPGLCNLLASLPTLHDDSLLNGLIGWAGLDYSFALSEVTDPDGDPITLEWVWSDGVTGVGATHTRSFPLVDALRIHFVDLVVRVVEDVSAHCDVDEVVQTLQHRFMVVPDLSVLLSLVDGLSCDAGRLLSSTTLPDYIAILCDLRASVDTHGAPAEIVDTVTIQVDDAPIATGAGSPFSTRYDALTVPDGQHVLTACATAVNDKYARSFCSLGYSYTDIDCTNLPPLARLLGIDGMGTGVWGWADHLYGYTADVQDPDGDPLVVSWTWQDGVTATGTAVSRDFALGGGVAGVMTVLEDTTRCPFFPGAEIDVPLPTFSVLPDLSPLLDKLTAGLSCDVGSVVPSWNEFDIVGVSCPVSGRVDLAGAPQTVLGDLYLQAGGRTLATSDQATLQHTYRAASVGEGLHDLEVCATGHNDKYGRTFCSAPYTHYAMDCTNTLPKLTGVATDGFGPGGFGWTGLPYTFSAVGVRDAENDPVLVEWSWEDGTSSLGPSASRSFVTGAHGFTVALYEDVSGRCPLAKTAPVFISADPLSGRAFRFETLADWSVTMLNPQSGWSCVGGVYVRSVGTGGIDMMSGRCNVSARVDMQTKALEIVPQGVIRLDGKTLHEGQTSLLSVIYDSLKHSFDEHTLDACYGAKGDKYGRTFCSAEYDYVNIGR